MHESLLFYCLMHAMDRYVLHNPGAISSCYHSKDSDWTNYRTNMTFQSPSMAPRQKMQDNLHNLQYRTFRV